jgi:hypothetical protein
VVGANTGEASTGIGPTTPASMVTRLNTVTNLRKKLKPFVFIEFSSETAYDLQIVLEFILTIVFVESTKKAMKMLHILNLFYKGFVQVSKAEYFLRVYP